MSQSLITKDEATKHRNKKRYRTFIFRVRRNSDLERCILEFAAKGNTSVNFLLTKAICKYFKCNLPHFEYRTYKRTPLYYAKDDKQP